MPTISQRQNEPSQLTSLAAQRQLYSEAKRIQALHMFLSVPCVIVLSLLVAVIPNLQIFAAFGGILLALIDITVLTPSQKSRTQWAAKIQELFDCVVLGMSWNKIAVGSRPEIENIVGAANKYKRKEPDFASLENWYPPQVDELPLYLGRLVCQRINCWWDTQMRRRYANIMIGIVGGLALVVLLIGLIGGLTLEKFFLAVLMPLMPAVLLGMRQSQENRASANRLDTLKQHADSLWDKAIHKRISQNEVEEDSRKLQDEIYIRRSQTPLIFDWIYNSLKTEFERQMTASAAHLVEEAKRSVEQ